MEKVLNYIDERVNKLNDKLVYARKMYAINKGESWAGRVGELATAIEELEKVAKLGRASINRH